MAGQEVPVVWQGRTVRAWVPAPLADRALSLSEATVRRTEQAAALARRGDEVLAQRWEPLARLLLRAEGVASSFIEGVRAPLAEVAAAELDPTVGESARWVADNLAVVRGAAAEARRAPLDRAALDRWHRRLMQGADHLPPRLVGAPRDAQGWIGGTSPLDAALVTPPPSRLDPLLDDLVAFANRTDVDPVTQAAMAHAQFEVIHPYADGNGRVGRVLVGWVLTRRLGLATPPPVSVRIASDRGGYLSGLTLFRLGPVDPWVRWFADVVAGAGQASVDLVRAAGELRERWAERLVGVRAGATALEVLDLLPQHPVLAANTVADVLGVSERTGRNALALLAERGVVEPFAPSRPGRGRPRQWWVAPELVHLVGKWSG